MAKPYRPRRESFRGPYYLKTRYWDDHGRYIGLWQRNVESIPDTGIHASWMATEVVYYDPAQEPPLPGSICPRCRGAAADCGHRHWEPSWRQAKRAS